MIDSEALKLMWDVETIALYEIGALNQPSAQFAQHIPCGDRHIADGLPYYCTCERGHSGPHVAHGGAALVVCAAWYTTSGITH